MKRLIITLFILSLALSSLAGNYKYTIGFKGGMATLSGSDETYDNTYGKFTFQKSLGASLGIRLKDRLFLNLDYSNHSYYSDSSATSSFTFGVDKSKAKQKYKASRLSMIFSRMLGSSSDKLNLIIGLGGGAMLWKFVDPVTDTVFEVLGIHNETVEFSASELFLTGDIALQFLLSRKWSLGLNFQADYLSGAGAEFAPSVNESRNRWQFGSFLKLQFHFGEFISGTKWKSRYVWEAPHAVVASKPEGSIDGDSDGIPDKIDQCLDTRWGAVVDRYGCPVDGDRDGVPDGLDDCPTTDRRAIGFIDIYGCPVDSDFDGVADYLDNCPTNRPGAHVDETGCPVDTDGDGVPDGLDDCPNTLYGMEVDKFGCIDLSMLAKPMVLNIDYPSGSFEIDPKNKERLKSLARILNFVKDIRLEINGYTDNIGTTVANQRLSEKRARRVLDYLKTQGISPERIKVFGRGESNFIASNNTAKGRAENRRIEIMFFK